jgi:anaerobic magnesium-protoporphyrin IX monomethyl ester cyclase
MSRALLINPSYSPSYGGAKGSIVNPIHPTLGLSTIAATAIARGHQVRILDMSWRPYDWRLVKSEIDAFKPDVVGITATTPLMNQLRDMSVLVRDISKDIRIVGGGAHPSALPAETLDETMLDAVFAGEADYSFADLMDGVALKDIAGLWYRDAAGKPVATAQRHPIHNLDDLPMPAWELYNAADYRRMSRLLCRRPPVTMAEFSRGCVFRCDFCASKITMALGYRKKSPERCAEEVKRMHALGYREFLLADDIFTSDQDWASDVCDAIARTGVDMAWSCTNGIRVESADDELFRNLRRAGCYRVSFGFESGNDRVLESFGKGGRASIVQGRNAVRIARKAGIDTSGFFLLGLSPDTEETMKDTIAFARSLELDMMKFGVTVAFPGTQMFNQYMKKGLIRSFNWDDYFIYTDEPLFAHERLDYETIRRYMKIAYRRAILHNPGFIRRRIMRGFRTGEFFWDVYYGLKFVLMPETTHVAVDYYARDRWPTHDFAAAPPKPASYQVVRKAPAAAPASSATVVESAA